MTPTDQPTLNDAEQLYRIKPLVWDDNLRADTCILGVYTIRPRIPAHRTRSVGYSDVYEWTGPCRPWHGVETVAKAKAAAEKHYRERLLQCLEEV